MNIQAGTFNINALTKCQVIQNGVPVLDDALLQLVSVNKSQYTNSYEEDVTYSVLIKDSKAEFFSAITNVNLTDLDFSDLDHTFDAATIVSSFNNTVSDGYKYVMPYSNGNVYQANEFKPGIYAKTYFDRIFSNAGFTYTWAGLSDAHFDKLLIPYNGDVNNFDYADYRVEATNTWTTSYVQGTGVNYTFQEDIDSGWTEVVDAQSLFNPTNGEYSSPFSINPLAGEHYTYELQIGGSIILDNNSGGNAVLEYVAGGYIVKNKYRVFAEVFVQGLGNVKVYGTTSGVAYYPAASPLPTGNTTVLTFAESLSIPALTNDPFNLAIDPNDIQILSIGVEVTQTYGSANSNGANIWIAAGGGITVGGVNNNQITLNKQVDIAAGSYVYDMAILFPNGNEKTYIWGNFIAQVKDTAGKLLAQTDWYVVRKLERNVDIPAKIITKRAAIVTEANRLETAITNATSVEALIEVLNAQNWGE